MGYKYNDALLKCIEIKGCISFKYMSALIKTRTNTQVRSRTQKFRSAVYNNKQSFSNITIPSELCLKLKQLRDQPVLAQAQENDAKNQKNKQKRKRQKRQRGTPIEPNLNRVSKTDRS